MATTATLNGGPTGGLHATSTLIHSENPPQEETCRAESNSSFESGNDEIIQHSTVLPGDNNPNTWSICEGIDRSFDSESQTADFRGSMDAKGKKRRKQSRPVRIPATDLPVGQAREHGSLLSESAGTGSEGDEAGELSTGKNRYNSETKPVQKEKFDDEEGVVLPSTGRQQLPLNLKYEPDSESGGQQQSLLSTQSSSVLTSCFNIQSTGNNNNSSIEIDKTEAAGHGTKRSPSPLTRVLTESASPTNSRQFSPPLYSSPFAAIFPTASCTTSVGNYFQQQSSNFQQTSSGGIHPSGHPPPGTPNSTSSTGSNQNGQSGSTLTNMPPHRIFNPEAYCDLCNKEFCNKYFLKTHKANKHGVYSEVSSASLTSNQILAAAISSSPSNSNFLNITHSNANNPLTQVPSHQQITSAASSSSSASSILKGVSTVGENPFSFTSSFSTGEKNGSIASTSSQHQRESFCELCQKEFCNKYFLKRHKAKIHGIPIPAESSSSSVGKGGNSGSKSSRHGFSNGMNEKRSAEETLSGLPTLREIGLETLGIDLVTKHLEENAPGAGSGQSIGESGHQRDDADGANSDESNAPTNNFQSELMSSAAGCGGENARLRSPENLGENSSFKLSSLELKPQQLGTSNAENTCQFCFREFPSQQLLRSHIIKKHRLLLQSAFPPFLLSFQPMPPAFDDPTASESVALDSNGNNTELDYECNICNRSFQTVYLLRMHKSYFHPESEPDASDPLTAKLFTEAASMFTEGGGGAGDGNKSSNGREENEGDTDQGFDSDAEPEGKSESANKSTANVDIENRGEATSDSDDLRRLQTMIMELNRVSSNSVAWSPPITNVSTSPNASHFAGQAGIGSSLVCPVCSKEFYSSYFLQQHIQHYHSSSSLFQPDSSSGGVRVKIESPLGEINSNMTKKMNESGSMSGGSGTSMPKDRLDLGGSDPATSIMNSSTFLTPGPKGSSGGSPSKSDGGGERGSSSGSVKRPSPSLSRSYCTICHKELCNKYFMRTHMLKMHGISIESSTGLGGVTCDICNKELCSKYFLKVHKQNTHGIIEDGPSPPNPSTPGPPSQTLPNFPIVTPPIMNLTTGPTVDAGSPVGQGEVSPSYLSKDPSERFFSNFAEICPLCGKRFRSSKWLKSHLQSDHGQEGRDKWKAIEKSMSLQRRSPKVTKSNNNNNISSTSFSSSKIGGGGSNCSLKSGGGSGGGNSGQKHSSASNDGNKCALCGFSSGDTEVMRSHLIKEHGTQLGSASAHGLFGEAVGSSFTEGSQGLVLDPLTMLFQKMEGGSNKMYRCSYCPFTTSLLVYLYAHERTHTGLANTNPVTQDAKCPFQCPMCFHSFSQPEAFQQHLIGHQMSGVLAPFFTPTAAAAAAAAASSSCQYALLSQSENDPNGESEGPAIIPPSLLNGSAGTSSLYLALNSNKSHQQEDDGKAEKSDQEDGGAENLTMRRKQSFREEPDNNKIRRKPGKILYFRCSSCQAKFKTRPECITHINEDHKGKKILFKVVSTAVKRRGESGRYGRQRPSAESRRRQGNKLFRCRKCIFTCSTYTSLMVHSKIQHSIFRPGSMSTQEIGEVNAPPSRKADGQVSPNASAVGATSSNNNVTSSALGFGPWKLGSLPEGRGVPQEGIGDGDFIMQGFLLTSSEEESSNQSGYFVPSLVYLPVREKVSQSIRVSFSLTPTP